MRIHRHDLAHEIEKAHHARDALVGRRNEIDNALAAGQGHTRGLRATRVEIEADLDEIDQYLEMLENPDILEPCSSVARAAGCTCTMADYNPPEPVRSRHCPLHGSEPDEDERP
jgi:hypothetical protein